MKFTNKGVTTDVMSFLKEGSPFNEVDYLATPEFGDENREINELSVSGSIEQRMAHLSGIDMDDMTNSLLIEELRSSVSKTILKKCKDSKDVLFIDASGKNDLQIGQFFCDVICMEGITNVIVSGNIGSCIMDCRYFIPAEKVGNGWHSRGSNIYRAGTAMGCNIYIDPVMRWTEDEFISFNAIDVQIFEVKLLGIVDEATFAPRTKASVDYTYSIHFPKKLMVLMDNSPNPGKFKAYQRDIKLVEILKKN